MFFSPSLFFVFFLVALALFTFFLSHLPTTTTNPPVPPPPSAVVLVCPPTDSRRHPSQPLARYILSGTDTRHVITHTRLGDSPLFPQGKDGGVSRVGDKVQLRGWVRTVRAQKDLSFVEVNDGSSLSGIQAVVTPAADGAALLADGEVTTGAAVVIEGTVVESPGGGQAVEVSADSIRVVGPADAATFPLQKKRHTLEFLRGIAHLRPRTNTIGAVTRVRNQLAYATHNFFQEHGCGLSLSHAPPPPPNSISSRVMLCIVFFFFFF